MIFNQEFCDRVEEMRVASNKDYNFMLAVVNGSEDAVAQESARKKAMADEIAKEKFKTYYDADSSFAQLLAQSDGSSKVTEEELETVMEVIEKHFSDKDFKSKDVLPLLPKVNGEPFLNNRKLPSRLKKLSQFGKIEDVPNTKPKAYKLVKSAG